MPPQSAHLMAEEIARYHEDGYVVPRYRLPDDVLAQMRAAYDELLAANPEVASDIMLGPHMERPGAQGVKGSTAWLGFPWSGRNPSPRRRAIAAVP